MAVHIGTSVDVTSNVYDVDGDLANPTTMIVYLRAPDGSQEDYVFGVDSEVTNPSTGVWVFSTPPLNQVKKWWVAFVGAGGDVTVTDEISIEVCGLHVALPV
jgi:hypothetical protein